MISIKRNYLYNCFQVIVNIFFPVITIFYISRIFGPSILGRVNFAISLVSFLSLIASLAIPLYGSREIARVRDNPNELNKKYTELFIINFTSSFFFLFIYSTLFLFSVKMREEWLLFTVTGMLLVFNSMWVDWLFQGLENYKSIAFRNIVVKIISLCTIFILVRKQDDYIFYAALNTLSIGIYNILGLIEAKKVVYLKCSGIQIKSHFRSMLLILGIAAGSSICTYSDIIMLGMMSDDKSVGLYSAAIRIPRIVTMLVTSLSTVLIPRSSYYLEKKMFAEFDSLSQKSLDYIYLISIPLTVIVFAFSHEITLLIFGKSFLPSSMTLKITSLMIIPLVINYYIGLQIMYPKGEDFKVFAASILTGLFNIVSNLIFIPLLSYNGPAISGLLSQLCFFAVLVFYKKNYNVEILKSGGVFKYLTVSLLLIIWITAIKKLIHEDILRMLIGSTFFIILYILSLLTLRDKTMIEIKNIIIEKFSRIT